MVPRSVTSADGTRIGYRELGEGPGVVLVHGGMQSAQNFDRLAKALSGAFRVCVPDRRGRGRSGGFGPAYGLARETEDLSALLAQTSARYVFGLSSGALIALHAALELPITKLAIYEPPLTIGEADPARWVAQYEQAIERGDLAAAMVTVLKGTGDARVLTYLPSMLLVPMLRQGIRKDAAEGDDTRVKIRDLIPTMGRDAALQREASAELSRFAQLSCKLLLMGGARSHQELRRGLDSFAALVPHAKRVTLGDAGHVAADNNGKPELVAAHLRAFFEQS